MISQRCVLNLIKTFLPITMGLVLTCVTNAYSGSFSSTNGSVPSLSDIERGNPADAVARSAIDADTTDWVSKVRNVVGINYFSYFFGPGLHPDKVRFSPNQLGLTDNDGVFFQNQVSLRFKFSSNLALDLQTRFKLFLNNYEGKKSFSVLRWETPRIGVSGRLFSGDDWTLIGAVNTEFPYFFPPPLSGYQAQHRTAIFSPGMFASFRYEPKLSPWSVFAVIQPRYFIYADRDAVEEQFLDGGFVPGNKPELIIAFQPTINYRLSSYAKVTLGTQIDYRKHVLSSWNPFQASLATNGEGPAWRLNAVPLYVGVTFAISENLNVFPYVTTFPIAAQRVDARTGKQATFSEATSVGMWISGTIF